MSYPTIEQFIGGTPLVRLQRLAAETGATVLAKLEGNNPAGSVKDRPALSMIRHAEQRGEIRPGDTLIEATSGNTGIALAMAAAIRGYRMVLVMPEHMSVERRGVMRAYGAEIILTPRDGSMEAAIDKARAMEAADPPALPHNAGRFFRPAIDGITVTRDAAQAAGERGIPILIGTNDDEGTMFALHISRDMTLGGAETPERIRVYQLSVEILPILGVEPAIGREFTAEEDHPDGERVTLLSHALWQQGFAADPEVVGRTIVLEGIEHTVIGVMPAGFAFPDRDTRAWIPLRLDRDDLWERNNH